MTDERGDERDEAHADAYRHVQAEQMEEPQQQHDQEEEGED